MQLNKILYIIIVILFFATSIANATLLFEGPYEADDTPMTSENEDSPYYKAGSTYDCTVVESAETGTVLPRAGTHFMRSYTQLDGEHYRSEVVPKVILLEVGTEYWIGFSMRMPDDWVHDIMTCDTALIFQIHHQSWVEGLNNMALPLNLSTTTSGTIKVRLANGNPGSGSHTTVYEYDYTGDIGNWVDWVFNVKFSDTSAGFLNVYKDGILVAEVTGQNYGSGHEGYGANIQFGIYNWGYREPDSCNPETAFAAVTNTIYHDELRVGDANSSLSEVSPSSVADIVPPEPNPATFSTSPAADSDTQITMISTTGTDDGTVSYQFDYDPASDSCGSDADIGTGGTDCTWQASATCVDSGLQPNQVYCYNVQMRDDVGTPNVGTASATVKVYTHTATPGAPVLSNEGATFMDINNVENGNPLANPATKFAISCISSVPADPTWQGQYIDASGDPQPTSQYLTDAQFDAMTGASAVGKSTPLNSGTTYGWRAKAINEDGRRLYYSTTGYGTTTGESEPPPPGTQRVGGTSSGGFSN